MKKLILVLILVFMLAGCKKKEFDYYCQITGRDIGGYEVFVVVDYYEIEDNVAKLYIENGSFQEFDLDDMKIICTKMEEIE